MEEKEITDDLLWIEVLQLREELSIYERDILYMSKHREAIDLDDCITHEFKWSILDHIDEEIKSLINICLDLRSEIRHYEWNLAIDDLRNENKTGQAE